MFHVYGKKSGIKKNKEAKVEVVNFKSEPQK